MDFEKLIRVIELLRPKFYDNLTWAIALAGLALMSTPLWLEIVNAVLRYVGKEGLAIEAQYTWGFALVALALLYNSINTGLLEYAKTKSAHFGESPQTAHDKRIFEAANELTSESRVNFFVENLLSDHSFWMESSGKLDDFTDYLDRTENQFLDRDLARLAAEVSSSWKVLGDLLGARFFIWPEHQTGDNCRLCMQPNWNIDRGGRRSENESRLYMDLTRDLRERALKFKASYQALRMEIKRKLFV